MDICLCSLHHLWAKHVSMVYCELKPKQGKTLWQASVPINDYMYVYTVYIISHQTLCCSHIIAISILSLQPLYLLFTLVQLLWWVFWLANHAKGQDLLANYIALWAGHDRRFLMYHHHPMDWLVCCRARWSSFWEILTVPQWGTALVRN